jgi:hypothetical protein|tara:strand:- start:123 stop:377 length:255 start_codon:yes stop_codon:yes gene_type:complete
MNTVQITEEKNTVTVNETTNTVTVTEGNATVITVSTQGPQGPAGTAINLDNAVDDSILYFHAASGTLKADDTTTKLTLVNGGNF